MKEFVIEIAGVSFAVHSLFESTRDYCREYWSCEQPEFVISVSNEDLRREQVLLDLEADEEGLKRRRFSDMFLERAFIQRRVAEYLLERNTLLLHGSTVAVDDQAYLFTAACGTGKSTHTRLWREVFCDRAVMVNDDKPFLSLNCDGVLAYGSPWTGKHGLGSNVCCPLKGICILKRGNENRIRQIDPSLARDILLHQCFHPEGGQNVLPMVNDLMDRVVLWEMECTKDPSAALIAWSAMSGIAEV